MHLFACNRCRLKLGTRMPSFEFISGEIQTGKFATLGRLMRAALCCQRNMTQFNYQLADTCITGARNDGQPCLQVCRFSTCSWLA